jgi:hypothetical protein
MNFVLVHEIIPTVGHCFLPATYHASRNWDEFVDWCTEQFGGRHMIGDGQVHVRWYTLGKEVTVMSETDAIYVKLRWDTVERKKAAPKPPS